MEVGSYSFGLVNPGLAHIPGVVMQVDVDNFRGLTDSRTQNFE